MERFELSLVDIKRFLPLIYSLLLKVFCFIPDTREVKKKKKEIEAYHIIYTVVKNHFGFKLLIDSCNYQLVV